MAAAQKAAGEADYEAYQTAFKARETAILAQKAATEAERAVLLDQVKAYLATLGY